MGRRLNQEGSISKVKNRDLFLGQIRDGSQQARHRAHFAEKLSFDLFERIGRLGGENLLLRLLQDILMAIHRI